jgi:hypothetical protein
MRGIKNLVFLRVRVLLLGLSSLALVACAPQSVEETNTKVPIVRPKPIKIQPKSSIKLPEKVLPLPSGKAPYAIDSKARVELPQGWQLIDNNDIVEKVIYSPELGGVLLSLDKDSGLNIFSAEDAQSRHYYRGMVDGAHLVALPNADVDKILVIANNRKNARFSIWLKRQ